jgi:HK97 gp10 family phage protein
MFDIKIKKKNLKELSIKIGKASKGSTKKVYDFLFDLATDLRTKIILSMRNTKKASWFYARQKGKKKHFPSAPGNPPAIDSGELIKQIKIISSIDEIEVLADTEYAPYLEDGTKFMKARPFMKPAIEDIIPLNTNDKNKIKNEILKGIK